MKGSMREMAYGYLMGELSAKYEKVRLHVEEHPKDEHAAIRLRALEEALDASLNALWYGITHLAAQERQDVQDALADADAAEAITGGESIRDIGPSFDELEKPNSANSLAQLFEAFDGGIVGKSEVMRRASHEIDVAQHNIKE